MFQRRRSGKLQKTTHAQHTSSIYMPTQPVASSARSASPVSAPRSSMLHYMVPKDTSTTKKATTVAVNFPTPRQVVSSDSTSQVRHSLFKKNDKKAAARRSPTTSSKASGRRKRKVGRLLEDEEEEGKGHDLTKTDDDDDDDDDDDGSDLADFIDDTEDPDEYEVYAAWSDSCFAPSAL